MGRGLSPYQDWSGKRLSGCYRCLFRFRRFRRIKNTIGSFDVFVAATFVGAFAKTFNSFAHFTLQNMFNNSPDGSFCLSVKTKTLLLVTMGDLILQEVIRILVKKEIKLLGVVW